jgi:hypothetical protein
VDMGVCKEEKENVMKKYRTNNFILGFPHFDLPKKMFVE